MFVRGREDDGLLCENFFRRNNNTETMQKIAKIRLEDLLTRGGIKMLYQINMELEINFTLVQYMRLSEAITFFLAKKEGIAPAVPIGISVFSYFL
jgi:hypothetical protein